MSLDELGPAVFEVGAGVEVFEQPLGLTDELGGLGSRFVGDDAAQFGVSGEGVDVALLDPVETQSEHQIFTDEGNSPSPSSCAQR